eukprot:scaffold18793_cov54-Cyclotella_meneghiniana.AAC.1
MLWCGQRWQLCKRHHHDGRSNGVMQGAVSGGMGGFSGLVCIGNGGLRSEMNTAINSPGKQKTKQEPGSHATTPSFDTEYVLIDECTRIHPTIPQSDDLMQE